MPTLIVTSNADSGAGTLRQALSNAATGDTIHFDPALGGQTITLSTGQLTVNKNLTIDATGAPNLTISGNSLSRIFDVRRNPALVPTTATIKKLRLINGRAMGTGEPAAGGAILTDHYTTLTVEDCYFGDNVAAYGGGGIFGGYMSNITVTNCTFHNNDGTPNNEERGGGGIANKRDSVLVVRKCTFTNNKGINGGAINNLISTLTVEDCIFIENTALATTGTTPWYGFAGAILNDGDINRPVIINNCLFQKNAASRRAGAVRNEVAPLTISKCAFVENSAGNEGGGLWIGLQSPATITNCTFSGNKAESETLGGSGAAMAVYSNAEIVNSTFANNYAKVYAGAIFAGSQPTITVSNCIFDRNTAANQYKIWQHSNRALADGGSNLQFPNKLTSGSSDTNVTLTITIIDPLIGVLQNNGGPTPTHALLAGSPAINNGKPITGLTSDQRGALRADSFIDIGAFEYAAPFPPNTSNTIGAQTPTDSTPTDSTPTDSTPTDPTSTDPTSTDPTNTGGVPSPETSTTEFNLYDITGQRGHSVLNKLTATQSQPLNRYRFTIHSRCRVRLGLVAPFSDLDLRLFNNGGGLLAQNIQRGKVPESISLVLDPGTFYIHVSPGQGYKRPLGRYRLRYAAPSSL